MAESITVKELIESLVDFCHSDRKVLRYKVYMGSDPEGNGYGSISPGRSFQIGELDKVLTIMPDEQLLDGEIVPLEMAELRAEMEHDAKVEALAS